MNQYSVLIPVYNGTNAVHFDEALRSIFLQTATPTQVVITLDGPVSRAHERVVERYRNLLPDKVTVLRSRRRVGLSAALNAGLNVCRYQYVARMDADDYAHPKRIEYQLAYLHKHPEVDILGTNVIEYDDTLSVKLAYRKTPRHYSIRHSIMYRSPLNHPTVVMRRSAVMKLGGYRNIMYFEDYDLWVRCYLSGYTLDTLQYPLVAMRSGASIGLRRGGLEYAWCALLFQWRLVMCGLFGWHVFICNTLVRTVVALAPTQVRSLFYKMFLRQRA